jgi:putative ABC transport system permease protein
MRLDHLRQDARYALRSFARSPLFTLTAVLSLAIGIGADTAVFSVANGLLLRPPSGVTAPDRLVDISGTEGGAFGVEQVSFPNYLDIREQATTIADLYGYEPFAEPMSLTGPDGAERVFGHEVTTNYFAVLGVRAAAGRLFDADQNRRAEAEHTVVLSHRYWISRFSRDPAIIGRDIRLNSSLFTVVGVAAEEFTGTSLVATDLWMPLGTIVAPTSYLAQRGLGWALIRGRLKDGVTVAQASAELDTIGRRLAEQYPDENAGKGLRLASASFIPGNLALPLAGVISLVLGFVSLVLVIACANLAGLLLARATVRRREIAVRVAVGAGRARLVQQLLTETTLLFVFGAAVSLLVARGLSLLIIWAMPALPVPVELSLGLDTRTLIFTMAVSLIAALACGLTPALDASKSDVVTALKNEADTASGRSRLRHAFVVSQVALSVVLVAGTGIFVRALQKTTSLDPGFDPYGVELASLDLSLAKYTPEAGQRLLVELSDRVAAIPGVEDATIAAGLPMSSPSRFGHLSYPGAAAQRRNQGLPADWNIVEPHYFSTMRIPIVAGRDFSRADTAGSASVMIVSEEAAKRYWPGQDPIGKVLLVHSSDVLRGEASEPRAATIVGVAGDVKSRLQATRRPQVYLPLQQRFVPRVSIAARTANGQRMAANIRQVVASMNPDLPVTSQTLEEAAAFALLPQRISASVSGGLGLVGLLLATMGIYAVTSFAVARRTREIGIRIALGAAPASVIGMVLRVGMTLVVTGAAVGLLIAVGLNAALTRIFFGFPPLDAVVLASAALLFTAIGVAACYVPVRRATIVNPAVVLRAE